MTNAGDEHGNGEIVGQAIEILRPEVERLVQEGTIGMKDGQVYVRVPLGPPSATTAGLLTPAAATLGGMAAIGIAAGIVLLLLSRRPT